MIANSGIQILAITRTHCDASLEWASLEYLCKTRATLSISSVRRPISVSGPTPTQPYESTIRALEPLYPRQSPGGYCIIDDFYAAKECGQAIADYPAKHRVKTEIIDLNGISTMWRER